MIENRTLSVFTESVAILRKMATRGSVEALTLREDLVGMHRVRIFARAARREEIASTEIAAGAVAASLREEYGDKLQVTVVIGPPLDERFGL
jgi:hypothetical protein